MELLKVPELLRGRWEHLLIMTFGIDIPFFENALLRQLGKSCTNRVVLANGEHYLQACSTYAENDGLVRHVNSNYVLEGVFYPNVSHAKVILLANKNKGRLLVGSGNLSYQGYASGGEMFTHYEYNEDDSTALPEFIALRHCIEELIEGNYLGLQTVEHIQNHLFSQCGWLYAEPDRVSFLRHNMHSSFIDQLASAVNGRDVDEMWVMTPFYDEDVQALTMLLDTLNPSKANVLLQKCSTSIDPVKLMHLVNSHAVPIRLWDVERDDNPYLHAKFVLCRIGNKGICIQGSPNMSRVAFLNSGKRANFEIANLLDGAFSDFEHMIDHEYRTPVDDIDVLGLSYHGDNDNNDVVTEQLSEIRLRSARWLQDTLQAQFDKQDAIGVRFDHLILNGKEIKAHVRDLNQGMLHLQLPDEAVKAFAEAGTLSLKIVFRVGNEPVETNPVFVCNVPNLNKTLEKQDSGEHLPHIGDLSEIDDEIFEALVFDLQNALVIDGNDFWQIAKSAQRGSMSDDSDESDGVDYKSIDYDELGKHPKLLQYAQRNRTSKTYHQTPLQRILNAIIASFDDFVSPEREQPVLIQDWNTPNDEVMLIEDMEELEELEAEKEEQQDKNREKTRRHIKRILTKFIDKYIAGVTDEGFRDAVGLEVIVHNYIIFQHILWHLYFKDWLGVDFVTEKLVQTLVSHWGGRTTVGFFQQIDGEDIAWLQQYLREKRTDSQMLACIAYGSFLCVEEQLDEQRLMLRDFWRTFIVSKGLDESTSQVIEDAYTISKMKLQSGYEDDFDLIHEFDNLLWFDTRSRFARAIQKQYADIVKDVRYDTVGMRFGTVPRMTISVLRPLDEPYELLAQWLYSWMRFENQLDYYRIEVKLPDTRYSSYTYVIQYADEKHLRYFDNRLTEDDAEVFDELPIPDYEWWAVWSNIKQSSEKRV